jgi:hypothetical protein
MTAELIEQKFTELTRRVAALEAKTGLKRLTNDAWREAVGAMKDCDLFDEALRLGAEWRTRANDNGR